jgi:transposase-like protein
MKYTFKQFQTQYPTDDACLEAIMARKFGNNPTCPGCGVVDTKFFRVTGRRSFACQWCGHHVYPCAGTPFEKSSTPLTLWFHAMYLMTATRNGVSAKELERQLGVTYKTAWRIGHELRKLMGGKNDTNPPMSGHVELDETYVGGKEKNKHANKRTKGTQGAGSAKTKAIVFGALERDGNINCQVVTDTTRKTLEPIIQATVTKGATISTDEMVSYKQLPRLGYNHGTVQHGAEQYVNGIHHINGTEGFWKHLKCGIISTHIHVSRQHLQKYVNEFSFRYNNRHDPAGMFNHLMASL